MALDDYLHALAFHAELRKVAEDAPGIPSRKTSHELPEVRAPKTWEFAIHRHDATKRGLHFDLRLGDPSTGHAHSWALPPKMPEPGESTWVVQQPTHSLAYMNFTGTIPEGVYGAGRVGLEARGKAEVLNARPGHVSFNVYEGQSPQEFTLHRVDGEKWKLYNRTLTREDLPEVPTHKPEYRSTSVEKIDPEDTSQLMSVKVDDAHNLFVLQKDKKIRVVSYRSTERPGGVIEHSHKVPSLHDVKTPSEVAGTVLRGGLFSLHPVTGEATPAHVLGGLLNSGVWKSREGQKVHGKLIPVIYDVVRFKGKDLSSAPYKEKLDALEAVQRAIPAFTLPRMAHTPKEKERLLADLKGGRVRETKEGVVLWPIHTGAPPIKAKFTSDHDVHVRGFYPAERGSKYEGNAVGGFEFSHTPSGKVVGRVGTGLSDELRRDMNEHPRKYLGAVAVVHAQERFESGALRAPSFKHWHLDKNESLEGLK